MEKLLAHFVKVQYFTILKRTLLRFALVPKINRGLRFRRRSLIRKAFLSIYSNAIRAKRALAETNL